MDRTIIPNGQHSEHPDARERFRKLCGLAGVTLVYVTGRHLQLVKQAIIDYNLPDPDYAITDVGTKIYRRVESEWREMDVWQKMIAQDWCGKTHLQIQQALSRVQELTLQEKSKQNEFKVSYYLPLNVDRGKLHSLVDYQLAQLGVAASIIWSIDERAQVGLLDILPRHATKLHSIEFLQRQLGYSLQEVIFAGDSGNDLQVLGSSIRSVLVANASPEIKQQALQLARENGCVDTLYLAQQEGFTRGGNYTAGVVQGVVFFEPRIGERLKLS